MSLTSQVQQDLIQALKQKDVDAVLALRGLKAALQKASIAALGNLTAEKELAVLRTEIKQRQDSSTAYNAGGRADLASQEQNELKILQHYQPAQLSTAELTALIKKLVAQQPQAGFGSLMKQSMAAVHGQADGKQVQTILKQILAQPM
ncbi:MAG: GatB/YqeY domain-containing protein [Patescibacteria group bacterium]|jgi:hypothetical protein